MNTVKRWKFTDVWSASSNPDTYTFPRNPREMTGVYPERSINSMTSTRGRVLLFEGTVPAKQFTFSGPILEKSHFDALRKWTYLNRRILIEDHYGRKITCVLTQIDLVPVRRVNIYYSHDYVCTGIITNITEPTVGNEGPT